MKSRKDFEITLRHVIGAFPEQVLLDIKLKLMGIERNL